jgi:hypothetical protein
MSDDAKMRRWCLLIAPVLLISGDFLGAQRPAIDVAAVVRETNQRSARPGSPLLAAWIPPEIWSADTTLPREQRTQIHEILSPYLLFVVSDGIVGPTGVTYLSERELRESTRLLDRERTRHASLEEQGISEDARVLLSVLGPSLERLFATGGIQVHLLVFSNRDSRGNRIAAAREPGGFSMAVGDEELSWTLPLRSLPPPE